MKRIRRQEFLQMTERKQFKSKIFDYGDLQLYFQDKVKIYNEVLAFIRDIAPAAIFSFSPFEAMSGFDHLDHEVAGNIARFVGGSSDVHHHLPEVKGMDYRPELFLRTEQKQKKKNVKLKIGKKSNKRRLEHLEQNYPSQFNPKDKDQWQEIFDRIEGTGKKKREYWQQVR